MSSRHFHRASSHARRTSTCSRRSSPRLESFFFQQYTQRLCRKQRASATRQPPPSWPAGVPVILRINRSRRVSNSFLESIWLMTPYNFNGTSDKETLLRAPAQNLQFRYLLLLRVAWPPPLPQLASPFELRAPLGDVSLAKLIFSSILMSYVRLHSGSFRDTNTTRREK